MFGKMCLKEVARQDSLCDTFAFRRFSLQTKVWADVYDVLFRPMKLLKD